MVVIFRKDKIGVEVLSEEASNTREAEDVVVVIEDMDKVLKILVDQMESPVNVMSVNLPCIGHEIAPIKMMKKPMKRNPMRLPLSF